MKEKISTYAKRHDITYHTAYSMVKKGLLESEKLPTGTILIITEGIQKKDD